MTQTASTTQRKLKIGNHPSWLVLHAAIILAGFSVLLAAPIESRSLPLLGQPAPFTVTARSRVSFIDTAATNRLKLNVESAVPTVFQDNLSQANQNRELAAILFQNVGSILNTRRIGSGTRQADIRQILRQDSISTDGLPSLTAANWVKTRYWSLRLLRESLDVPGFDASQIPSVAISLMNTLPRSLPVSVHEVVSAIVKTFLVPTRIVNAAATQKAQQAAASRVKPLQVTVVAGSVIVRRGQIVTPATLQELRAVGLPAGSADWRQRAGGILFVAVLVVLLFWYLRAFYPEIAANQRLMLLLDTALLVTAAAAKVFVPGHVLLPYFFPAAATGALAGLLISSEVGVSLAVVVALMVGWVVGGSFELTAYYLLTGVTAALAVRNLRRQQHFIRAGICIMLTAGSVIAAFQLLGGGTDLVGLRNYAGAAAFNGLVSGALAFGGFVVLGNAFGATTTLHLLELANPDQPLLRRLMSEAPGTYNHSLVVSSMVERACREIDANVLLGRVMALYHDVGKVSNPLCFVENQLGTTNIHDDLEPEESADIIRRHVTQGLTLLKQNRLPAPIRDAVLQHHGTTTMPYFFHRALQNNPEVDPAFFSYPGPLPQSKECGVLMLADACEGAVRASALKLPDTIRDTVNRIVDERVAGGQLNDCRLTLRDLEVVRQAFVDVLAGIYHPRIEYPVPDPTAYRTQPRLG